MYCVCTTVVYNIACFPAAAAVAADCLDQLEWQKSYCMLAKEDRKLFFFNDTEVS